MRRKWPGWLLLGLSGALAAQPVDPSLFRERMKARLEAAMPGADVVPVEGETLSLHISGGGWDEKTVNLDRLVVYCAQAAAQDCEAETSRFIAALSTRPPTVTADSLRIIVRDDVYHDYVMQVGAQAKDGAGDFCLNRSIGADLHAYLAADSPLTIQLVGAKTLRELGMTADEAWARAWAQTRAALPSLPAASAVARGAAIEPDEYGASLLFDRDGWARLGSAIGPDMIVTAVSDQFLFVGQMPNGAALDRFAQSVVDDCNQLPRCVSSHVYRLRDGQWVIAR